MTAPMLARRQLRLAVLTALQTIIGCTVESPPATATQPKQMPYVGLRCGTERKLAFGKQQLAAFTTTTTIEILARASAPTQQGVQDAIEALANSVEMAVLTAPTVLKLVQQVAGITSTTDISGEGSQYQAESLISIDFEMAEDFEPLTPPAFEGANVHIDAVRPFDANGIYANPPFPASVTAPPRAAGPDGRDEGYLQIDLPQ